MKLRRPLDKLAGCVWLPRFTDKARHFLAGTLDPEFVMPFGNPLATDGAFFAHFGIAKDEIVSAVRESADDDSLVAAWFARQPQATPERIAAWNELLPNLGKEGFPLRRAFLWAGKRYYDGFPDPRIVSMVTAIAYDEGFLDETA